MRHPSCVVAFAILREPSGHIVSFAAFRALRRRRQNYEFDIVHRAHLRDTADTLADMRAFTPAGSLLIGEAVPGEDSLEIDQAERMVFAALPVLEPPEVLGASSFVFRNHEQRLEGLAEGFGIALASPRASLQRQIQRLGDRAEALWVTFTATYLSDRDSCVALAAYQAWRAIEAAQPVGF